MADKDSKSLPRRDFLKAAGSAGAAVGAAVVLSGNEVEAAESQKGKMSGYQETEHVMKYYELARF
jgi:hypothetical protein